MRNWFRKKQTAQTIEAENMIDQSTDHSAGELHFDVADLVLHKRVARSSDMIIRSRVIVIVMIFFSIFSIIIGRLIYLGNAEKPDPQAVVKANIAITASRPDILDRNGEVLATDIRVPSLYAEPRRILDVDEVVDQISVVLPQINRKVLHKRLSTNRGFAWIKRELSPSQQAKIKRLGVPGIYFQTESRRIYPAEKTASHILGYVNVDNQGQAGVEKHIDDDGLAMLQKVGLASNRKLEPVNLSVDLRVQHILHQELNKAIERYQAEAAAGLIMDAYTGEILSMVSLPDFDPASPKESLEADRINRLTKGTYELGSVFKTFTLAMALDTGAVSLGDKFDATQPIRYGRFKIKDFHAKNAWLSVPEVYKYSSNIGTVKIMQAAGIDTYREFLSKLKLDQKPTIELPERGFPLFPKRWSEISAMTASFGHGIAVTPVQTVVALSAMVNGGFLVEPTLMKRSVDRALMNAQQVISEKTSEKMRYLLRLNVLEGSGRKANIEGYRIGGKTGTSEKVIKGRYAKDKLLNTFVAAFPMDNPRYVSLIMIDEPKRQKGDAGATAGYNAVPTSGLIISKVAPLLGVAADLSEEPDRLISVGY